MTVPTSGAHGDGPPVGPRFDSGTLRLTTRLAEEIGLRHVFHHAAIFLYDPAVDQLRLVGQRWGAGEDTGAVVAGDWLIGLDGVCGRVFRTGEPALLPDVRLDREYKTFPGSRTRSELAVPLRIEGQPVGVVNVESPHVGEYTVDDLEALEAWATTIGPLLAAHFAADPD